MKKKWIACLITLSCLASAAGLAACNGGQKPDGGADNPIIAEELNKKFTYSFESNGGSAQEGGSLYANAYVPAPADPVREGYRFTGWYFDEDCTKQCSFISTRMPAHDVVYYAGWQELVRICFESNGGSAVSPLEGLQGEEIVGTDQCVPVKEGYVFDGWYADETLTKQYVFTTIPAESRTLYAKWHEKNKAVTITFDGADCAPVTGEEAQQARLPVADDTQYTRFIGWATDEEGVHLTDADYRFPAQDVTLYAVYRQKQAYARIRLNASPYNDELDFYAKRGEKLARETVSLEGYEGDGSLVNMALLQSKALRYNGFLTETDLGFLPSEDIVVSDMTLNINVYSEGLVFDSIYTNDFSGGVFYGLDEVAAFFGKTQAELTDAEKSMFSKTDATVRGYNGTSDQIVIPRYYGAAGDLTDYAVSVIEEGAFAGKAIASVTIPDTVIRIFDNAFKGCAALQEVVFPARLSEVGSHAFADCASLDRVTLNDDVYYLGNRVFENTPFERGLFAKQGAVYMKDVNPSLKQDILYYYNDTFANKTVASVSRAGVVCVAGGAFAGKTNLERVKFGNDVAIIGENAFENCTDLKEVVLGTAVQYILGNAFKGCSSLVTFDKSQNLALVELGAYAFADCSSLQTFDFNEKLTYLGEGVFQNCSALRSVTMYFRTEVQYGSGIGSITYKYYSTNVKIIPEYAFSGCTSLQRIELMDHVTDVMPYAFENCTKLEYVGLGYTQTCVISKLHKNAFKGCTALNKLIVSRLVDTAEECLLFENGCFDANKNEHIKIYVSHSYIETYRESMKQEGYSEYLDLLSVWDTVAPDVEVTTKEVVIRQTYGYDVKALAQRITEYSDNETPKEDLIFGVTVSYNAAAVSANGDGTYDLTSEGTYIVTVRVTDLFGRTGSATFSIVVRSNEI